MEILGKKVIIFKTVKSQKIKLERPVARESIQHDLFSLPFYLTRPLMEEGLTIILELSCVSAQRRVNCTRANERGAILLLLSM